MSNILVILFIVLLCFLSCTNAEFRVIKGEDIDIKDSPHSVSIFLDSNYHCSGSIISVNSVVTAAASVYGFQRSGLAVLAGEADIFKIDSGSGQQRKVCDIICHDDYVHGSLLLNIAVLKVNEDFKWEDNVRRVKLYNSELALVTNVKVNGWGSKHIDCPDMANRYLQTTKMPIINKEQCQNHYYNIPNTIICAGGSGSALANADSGAGALVNDELCAVACFGASSTDIPDLFTDLTNERVKHFLLPHTR